LVPKSVTLNDLEWRNDRYFAFFTLNALHMKANYVKPVAARAIYNHVQKCSLKNLVCSSICRTTSPLTRGTPLSKAVIWPILRY